MVCDKPAAALVATGSVARAHVRLPYPACARLEQCAVGHNFAELRRESPPPAYRALHSPAPDRSADGCAIADSRSAIRSTADTSVPPGKRRDGPRSRRTSPRLLREIRRRFFYDFQVKLGVGQIAPQSIVLRFQLCWRTLHGRRCRHRQQLSASLAPHPVPQTRRRPPNPCAPWLMPTDSANRNASCLYSSVYLRFGAVSLAIALS